ncbi:fatty acid CoA ligase family protein [Desulfotalea psychrophila]|uniref:Probable peptide synthase n=1 Tax=Desulfotalea psychrophila (strain LSv54 / DSM 12343) TaxID=177439 RepID=Q6AJW6_DESPS|nr:fatty acid CoA ligase family protein [Desulfotalea psychrophila]CAG37360.1 probable peptide synthase [Desulfotalea psychrophila LSv54]
MLNIGRTLQEVAQKYGEQRGLVEAATGREMSFAELNRLSDSYAHYLRDSGVKSGDRVMLMVKPSADFICLTFALFKLGAPVILIDPGMGYKNLLRCIARVTPAVLIGIPKALLVSRLFRRTFSTIRLSFCCGSACGIFGPDIRRAGVKSMHAYPAHQPKKDDLAAIIFTTGSTGAPKGVRYEHDLFAAQREHVGKYYGIGVGDVDQPGFPLFALFSTSLGACAVIPDMDPTKPAQVDPQKYIASIEKYGVTYSFGSPAIWNVVSHYCVQKKIVLPSLKKVLMAGAPVSGELLQRVEKMLPKDAEIFTPYGATESLPIVSITGREILSSTWERSRRGAGACVGRALPGMEVRVITISDDPIACIEDVQVCAAGEIGEIIVRGNVVTRAYDNNAHETRLAKIEDGATFWHRMGDTGYLDVDGLLWFCGRRAHRVVTEAGTLFTIPCEAIVNEHDDVYRSALVAVKGIGGVTEPALIVEKKKGATISDGDLLEDVRALAAADPLTAEIEHFLVHRSFPVDIRHNAKIFREKLSVWASQELSRAK